MSTRLTEMGGDGEPFRLGLAQGRLQAEASSLELSVPVIPIPRLPSAIGCREMVRGLRGQGGESRESWLRAVCLSGLSLSLRLRLGWKQGDLPLVRH